MDDRLGSFVTPQMRGHVAEGTYSIPVSGSNAAPCQFAPPATPGNINTASRPFEPVTIGGVNMGPNWYRAATLSAWYRFSSTLK